MCTKHCKATGPPSKSDNSTKTLESDMAYQKKAITENGNYSDIEDFDGSSYNKGIMRIPTIIMMIKIASAMAMENGRPC